MKSPLPVPEFIEEDDFSFSFKQPLGSSDASHRRRPPKLQQTFNRSGTVSTAKVISFRFDNTRTQLSTLYDTSKPETYYEQIFEQLTKVGEGSFGEVFKVRSRDDGRLYAVKKSKTYFRSSQCRNNCLEEARQYEHFSDHENCVKLYQAWEQDDRLYMQMELCRENLEVYAREQQQLSDERIWSILLDLLLALKSLHDRNLIHLDIKLDNILVTDDGTCKLADFGLVFDLSKGNTKNAREGDSRYLAPELMAGRYTKAADIFSLGIATLELVCNLELPRNGRMWQRLRNGQPLPENLARKISMPLREIIGRMMKSQSEDRPSVDVLLLHPIIRALRESRRRRRILSSLNSYFHQKVTSLWRFVITAVMWIAACLRLQHRKFPSGDLTNDAYQGIKEKQKRKHNGSCCESGTSISFSGSTRNGISFGASRSFQDQASSLLSEDDDLRDDSLACSTSARDEHVHGRDFSMGTGEQADSDDIDKDSVQITPTLNNSIPTRTPPIRIVNSTPLTHHHMHPVHENQLHQLHHSRNGSRHASRLVCSPLRILWFDEDVGDISPTSESPRVNSITTPVPLDKQLFGRLNDSDGDIRPLGSSAQDLNASVQDDKANSSFTSSCPSQALSISSTPNYSLLHSSMAAKCASPTAGCDSQSSYLIKKKLRFNEEDDSP